MNTYGGKKFKIYITDMRGMSIFKVKEVIPVNGIPCFTELQNEILSIILER